MYRAGEAQDIEQRNRDHVERVQMDRKRQQQQAQQQQVRAQKVIKPPCSSSAITIVIVVIRKLLSVRSLRRSREHGRCTNNKTI